MQRDEKMLGESRFSRILILVAAVSASAAASSVIVASCLERGVTTRVHERTERRAERAAERAQSEEPASTTTLTSASEPVSEPAPGASVAPGAPENGAPSATRREEAPPADVTSPDTTAASRPLSDVLAGAEASLRPESAAPISSPSGGEATPSANNGATPQAPVESATNEEPATEEGENTSSTANASQEAPSPEERAENALREARFVAGTPVVQPRFEDVGAGPFLTEAPVWSASAMTTDPTAGAGPFTTELSISPSIVYFGVPSLLPSPSSPASP